MSYFCNDCGYAASKRFDAGKCPACGGFNIRKNAQPLDYQPDKRRSTISNIVMVLLWAALLSGLWQRYLADDAPSTNSKAANATEQTLPEQEILPDEDAAFSEEIE